jgi:hypothetical protein
LIIRDAPPLVLKSVVRADGKALTYLKESGNLSNIWIQPLDAGPPRQLTSFNSDRIVDFAWTRDGSQLICLRAVESSYLALIRDFD